MQYHRRCVLLSQFVFLILTVECSNAQDGAGSVSKDAADVIHRMQEHGSLGFDTAVGGYVHRTYNFVPDGKLDAAIANYRKQAELAKEKRIANLRAAGGVPDLDAENARMEANLADFKSKYPRSGLDTKAVRYFQQGERYRIEQFNLPNDIPMEALKSQLESGAIEFAPTYIRTWNGTKYAEVLYYKNKGSSQDGSEVLTPSEQDYAAVSFENRAEGVVRFTTFGRGGVTDPSVFQKIAEQSKLPVKVKESKTEEGESMMVLSVGSPESVTIYLEVNVLPTKGYSVASAFTMVSGAVMSREVNDGFVLTSAGFWLPTERVAEAFKIGADQVPYLFSKEELLAFEPPRTNISLSPDVFELSDSDQFKELPELGHLLPSQPPIVKSDEGIITTPNSSNIMVLIIFNSIIFGLIAGMWAYRRRMSK